MSIDDNKEALAMMRKALGSIENRFREAYNKGYHDGLKEGVNQTTQKIVDKIFEEVEADRKTEPQMESLEQFRVGLEYHTDAHHFGKAIGKSVTTDTADTPHTERSRAMRLIDADALCEKIAEWQTSANYNEVAKVIRTIVDTPTIDAVEVVRCRDCKWSEIELNCDRWCYSDGTPTRDDDYCSYGERSNDVSL